MTHYCFQCGTQLEARFMDNREREVCPACGWVYYAQLKVGAAVIIEQDDKLLLLQRAHEPWIGSWMIPAGYVEADEDPKDAAKREVLEETGLVVELSELVKTYYFADDPRGNGVSFVFRATKISGEMRINSEATNAKYFFLDEIPVYLTLGGHDKMIAEWCANAKQKETFS
ncbi:MAG: NUDIX hydrolase [Chloroflexota bacterium]